MEERLKGGGQRRSETIKMILAKRKILPFPAPFHLSLPNSRKLQAFEGEEKESLTSMTSLVAPSEE